MFARKARIERASNGLDKYLAAISIAVGLRNELAM